MHLEKVHYEAFDVQSTGYVAYPEEGLKKHPAIILAHAWMGLDDFVREKARKLAKQGYVAFAADVYGGVEAKDEKEAFQLMSPLFVDRSKLRNRIGAAYDLVKSLSRVDPARIGAIGFCFGGLTVIELMRSGRNVKGIVSFHGLLGNQIGQLTAMETPSAALSGSHALILHGDQDPLVSQQDIDKMKKELTDQKIDWQFHIFGNTVHAFTNPDVHRFQEGLCYDAKADKRSSKMMHNFFEEVFNEKGS